MGVGRFDDSVEVSTGRRVELCSSYRKSALLCKAFIKLGSERAESAPSRCLTDPTWNKSSRE